MRWGARCVTVAVVMSAAMSIIVGVGPVASATATSSLESVEVTGNSLCSHHEVRYTAHGEANNVTIEANDQQQSLSDEEYCPTPEETLAVVDTAATIAAVAPDCVAASSVGTCNEEEIDRVIVTTGAGDDTIRIGTMSPVTTTVIWAGAGNDTVRTLNRYHDVVNCGDGHDVVIADASDEIAPDCEVVQFTA